MGTSKFNAGGKLCNGLAPHPGGRGNTPSPVHTGTGVKCWHDGPLGPCADLTLPYHRKINFVISRGVLVIK